MKTLKKFKLLLMAFLMLSMTLSLFGCGNEEEDKDIIIEITIKNHGVITVELFPDIAPITVANFVSLVEQEFYDDLTFHRINTSMIQGGCPKGDGTSGSEKTIQGEFNQNGVPNILRHERGVMSMARSSGFNSASSQFFIVHKTEASYNGLYAAFGKVLSGMEIVDALAKLPLNGDRPNNPPVIEKIRLV